MVNKDNRIQKLKDVPHLTKKGKCKQSFICLGARLPMKKM